VDRERVPDAVPGYGYFRWLDDRLDQSGMENRTGSFLSSARDAHRSLLPRRVPRRLSDEEAMLVELVQGDREKNSGLHAYLRHMMAVMAFDGRAARRLISKAELAEYTRHLAVCGDRSPALFHRSRMSIPSRRGALPRGHSGAYHSYVAEHSGGCGSRLL